MIALPRSRRAFAAAAVLALAGAFAAPPVAAQMPSGAIAFTFTGDDQIFDLGQFTSCDGISEPGIAFTLCLTLDMLGDGRGKYEGTATFDFTGDITGSIAGAAKGGVRGRPGLPTTQVRFRADGPVVIGSSTLEMRTSTSCRGVVQGGVHQALCRFRLRLVGVGGGSTGALFVANLAGGDWTLSLDVVPIDAKKFGGTATDSLGNAYEIQGRYDARRGTSTATVRGLRGTASQGAQVRFKNLTMPSAGVWTGDVRYKVNGYKGDEVGAQSD